MNDFRNFSVLMENEVKCFCMT